VGVEIELLEPSLVVAEVVEALGLDPRSLDLASPEVLAAAIRRAASFLCPATPRALLGAVTDSLAGLPGCDPDTMDRPPRHPDENIFGRGLWQHIAAAGLLTAAVAFGLTLWEHAQGGPWQTMLFTSLVFLQLGDALAVRSESASTFTIGFASNRFLLLAVLAMFGAQLGAIYLPPFQHLLGTDALGIADLLTVLVASTITFFAIEAEKLYRRRSTRHTPQ